MENILGFFKYVTVTAGVMRNGPPDKRLQPTMGLWSETDLDED